MKKFFVAATILFFIGAGCSSAKPLDTTKPTVVTTIIPLTVVAENLLGDKANVQSILPPGAEPHEVTLSPRELVILSHADIILVWGMGLDTWAVRGAQAAAPNAKIISVADLLGMTDKDNPHVWLSPKKMIGITQKLSEALAIAFPQNAQAIQANSATYQNTLTELDSQFKTLAELPHHNIVTLHDAFEYLAADYGLHISGTVQQLPEDTPTPQAVAAVEKVLNNLGGDAALLGESGMSQSLAAAIAADTHHVVYTVNTLEVGTAEPTAYQTVMQTNLSVLQSALK